MKRIQLQRQVFGKVILTDIVPLLNYAFKMEV